MTGSRVCGTIWVLAMAAAAVTGAAVGQADWPTMWELRDKGRPISTEALERVVEGKAVIFDIGGYADGSG